MDPYLTDPDGSHPLATAAMWLQGTVLGTVATTAAVIAIASVGMAMLAGRIDLRRGASVLLGCFILFGATSIVEGLQELSAGGEYLAQAYAAPVPAPVFSPPRERPDVPNTDPYAGASLRPR